MTTNLPAIIEGLDDDEIMELTGQTSGVSRPMFPSLQINPTDETDDGLLIPKGTFSVYVDAAKGVVYGNPAKFRPFINAFQYRVYDAKEKKTTNKSIIFKSWNDEKFDELGGLACGKLPRKKWGQLTEKEQAAQDKIKCKRYLFGLVSFDGVLAAKKGEEAVKVKVENLPCVWRSGGKSFVPIGERIEEFTQAKKQMFNHYLVLGTERHKTGSNYYYTPVVTTDMQSATVLSKEDIDLLRKFQGFITQENNEIMEKWRVGSGKKPSLGDKEVIDVVAELAAPEDVPFDDAVGM
jgi:hypothetical protein